MGKHMKLTSDVKASCCHFKEEKNIEISTTPYAHTTTSKIVDGYVSQMLISTYYTWFLAIFSESIKRKKVKKQRNEMEHNQNELLIRQSKRQKKNSLYNHKTSWRRTKTIFFGKSEKK